MKIPSAILALLLVAPVFAGADAKPANPPARFELQQIQYGITSGSIPDDFVFTLGSFAYRSLTELKIGISRLPKGSTVVWAPSCMVFGGEPLNNADNLAALRAYCEAVGISLVIRPSG